jgi:NADPH:quinone reductase-like Zn-dependent oxidoreductase
VELLEQGRLRVLISSERPLADAVNALAESQAGGIDGKLVLTVA